MAINYLYLGSGNIWTVRARKCTGHRRYRAFPMDNGARPLDLARTRCTCYTISGDDKTLRSCLVNTDALGQLKVKKVITDND